MDKFDSGADVNTAFIAKELDFGALGSSPVARGLSAPLNIPYKVAFVLDVAGDNEALVARNGTGIDHDRCAARQAGRHAVRLDGALQPARRAVAERAVPDRCPAGRPAAAGDPRGVGPRRHRRRLHLAADARRAAQVRQGSDHQPPAGQGRQADAGPGRGLRRFRVRSIRRSSTPGASRRARALTTIKDDPGAAAKAIAAEIGLSPEDDRRTAQAGRLPDTRRGRVAGMARRRGQAGQHRRQPAERVAVPRRPEADPVGGATDRRSRTRSTPRGCPVSSVSDIRELLQLNGIPAAIRISRGVAPVRARARRGHRARARST